MESIANNLNEYIPYILGGMGIIIILLFILVIVLFKSINRVENRYRKLMRGTSSKNLEELIISQLDNIEESNKKSNEALERCEEIRNNMKECVQKVAIMRYKAFEDVGSDLSFSVAILDENNDGILLTGIYGRQESTTYAKPIDKGISRYDLSEEEKHVLNEAVNKKINNFNEDN
ncbi:MAG: DUF4446 family protein [Clostridium sp.]|uniref:DUF4446 family protein n=1 Tax=Clostridium sp. DSM 8431 TaxID=1761781 RepID=UPI0008E10077|nr:DUF4446 family protein [Clostridium sp. DSM 8431]MCR4943771.1 DUF4446 family protein [Clostridium sp.]SFU88808.1 Protein of unknown function [Clostridium sp. DSM 8431]